MPGRETAPGARSGMKEKKENRDGMPRFDKRAPKSRSKLSRFGHGFFSCQGKKARTEVIIPYSVTLSVFFMRMDGKLPFPFFSRANYIR